MKTKKIIAWSIFWASVLFWLALGLSEVFAKEKEIMPTINVAPLSVWELASISAIQFGQDPKLINKIVQCESGGKVASHDGGRGVNVTGIHDKTFNYWLPKYEKDTGETLDITSTYDQLKMLSWAFSKGEDYRRHWTSYRSIKNGGTYAFYSNLLKKHYVVKCSMG